MDYVITSVQVGPYRQRQFRSIKWLFPSLPGKTKDSVRVKKLRVECGYCGCVKEIPGWTIYTESVIVALPEQKLQELLQLLSILSTQLRIGGKLSLALGVQDPLHAHCVASGSSAPLTHPAHLGTGWRLQGLAYSGFSPRYSGLESACHTNFGLAHLPG